MDPYKSRSLENLEKHLEQSEPGTLRRQILECAKGFKSSWIEMGQYLAVVHKDKHYKGWGYITFEAYCAKEIGIRQATAVKLLKSYRFLEDEEPVYLKNEIPAKLPTQLPSMESVNALRLLKKNESLSAKEYNLVRTDVLDSPVEEKELKKKIKYILSSHTGPGEDEPVDEQRRAVYKRLFNALNLTRTRLDTLKTPKKIMDQIEDLMESLSDFLPKS